MNNIHELIQKRKSDEDDLKKRLEQNEKILTLMKESIEDPALTGILKNCIDALLLNNKLTSADFVQFNLHQNLIQNELR